VVEVAHEALLREWPRLADWIAKRAEDLLIRRHAESAAAEWQRAGAQPSRLWNHELLAPVYDALNRLGVDRTKLAEPLRSFLRPEAERLMKVTQESLMLAIETAYPGKRLGDIGHAVESHAARHGYTVVRELSGHGIGRKLHEDPQVPNYGPPGKRERLQPGMCLALEPMVNAGRAATRTLDDKWTVVTEDKSLSAHYELTIAVTEHGPWVLSEPYPFAQSVRHA